MTVFAMVAATFGDPEAPMAKLLDQYAGYMIGAEVVATLLFGFIALAVDRRQSLHREGEAPAEPRTPTDIQ